MYDMSKFFKFHTSNFTLQTSNPRGKLARTQKGVIEYTLRGQGPVVLVLHGTSSDCRSDLGCGPLLEAGFAVLTPSRPGYGRTPLEVGVSAEEAVEAVVSLLDYLKIERVSVIAVSGGGPTGLHLAARFPERVERLVLEAAVCKPFDPEREELMRKFYGRFHWLIWGMLRVMSRLFPRMMARQTMVLFSRQNTDEVMRRLNREDLKKIRRFYGNRSSAVGARADLGHRVGEEVFAGIKAPVLVVHSPEDLSVPFENAEYALGRIKGAALVEAGMCGHFIWLGPEAETVDERIVGFLKEGRGK